MAAERVRWRGVREFLDDLPVRHCAAKPPHEFCTICMRINYGVAWDCPLYDQKYVAPATRAALRGPEEPVRECVTTEDVKEALRGEEFPIIEFAGPRKAKAAGAPCAADGSEAPIEVVALEVVPMEVAPRPKAAPPKAAPPEAPAPEAPRLGSAPEGRAASEAPAVAGTAGGTAAVAAPAPASAPAAKLDPEELMHRIMEELDIPDEEEAAEPVEPEEGPTEEPETKGEAGKAPAPGEPRGKGPGPEAGRPRVVEKRIVLRRKKKGE